MKYKCPKCESKDLTWLKEIKWYDGIYNKWKCRICFWKGYIKQ